MMVANSDGGGFWLFVIAYLIIAYWQEYWPYRATFVPAIGYYVGEEIAYQFGDATHDPQSCLTSARTMAIWKGAPSRVPEIFCKKYDYWGRHVDNVKW